ncbi:alpha/beta hydrolase fold protein [Colletotrichum salicis]|uniref:Alpha/beta hydrolase fold protein n=1 Tax=Colletotrichum salicis TaxID=1209931 RepID=A0A135U0V7_9PEZI|nr:alpha/beta hydrolase fold protein [Colletotrichum salicis]
MSSNRFRNSADQLCSRVSAIIWKGYWICKGPPGKPQRPKDSDIVILWMHGGAYCFGSLLSATTNLLRVAETLDERGVSTSVFSVDYTLSLTARLPSQQIESVAAFRHLIEIEKIDAQRIILAGESAGGHLALTFLMALRQGNLPKPVGALLLYPWVNLKNTSPSLEANKNKDVLSKTLLDGCAKLATDEAVDGTWAQVGFIDLTKPLNGGVTWQEVLPSRTWVNVGTHDVFVHDIRTFVHEAQATGAHIELELVDGMPHGWNFTVDKPWEKRYLDLGQSDQVPAAMMQGSAFVAETLWTLLNHARE